MAIDYPEDFGPESVSEPGKDIKRHGCQRVQRIPKRIKSPKSKDIKWVSKNEIKYKKRPAGLSQRREQRHKKWHNASPTPEVTLACRVCM